MVIPKHCHATMRPVSQIVSIWFKQPREVWTALQFTRNLAQCIQGLERSNLYDIHHFTPPIAINILTACTLHAASFYHPAPIAPPLPPRPADSDSGDIHSNMFRCLKMWYEYPTSWWSIIISPISWYLMAIIGGIPNFQTNPDQFGTAKWTYSQTGNTLSTSFHLLASTYWVCHFASFCIVDFVGQSSFFRAIRNMTFMFHQVQKKRRSQSLVLDVHLFRQPRKGQVSDGWLSWPWG